MLQRPKAEEYNAYYRKYIELVPEGNLLELLATQQDETTKKLSSLTEDQENYRYAQGKWSVKEVLGHLIDTERIMAYRLLRFARGDQSPLAGYEDESYVKEGMFHGREMADLLEEYQAVRASSISLLRGIPAEAWVRKGLANNSECSARALAYIIAGHELHHRSLLADRYRI